MTPRELIDCDAEENSGWGTLETLEATSGSIASRISHRALLDGFAWPDGNSASSRTGRKVPFCSTACSAAC
jgi:hypothetical protein